MDLQEQLMHLFQEKEELVIFELDGVIANFDTYPASDAVSFSGAWSVYPYLPSANILVNDRSNGLFILRLAP